MEKAKVILRRIFDEELERRHFGTGWAWSKKALAEVLLKRYKIPASPNEVAKWVGEVSREEKYKFLMKTTRGYCFPRNEKEWDRYVMGRIRQTEGMMQENIRLSGLFFNR